MAFQPDPTRFPGVKSEVCRRSHRPNRPRPLNQPAVSGMIEKHPYALRYESLFSLIVCRFSVKKNRMFYPGKSKCSLKGHHPLEL